MPAAAARKIGKLTSTWSVALVDTVKGDFTCYQSWKQLGSAAAGCFTTAAGGFQHEQGLLAQAIYAVRPALQGACSDLATAALETTHRLDLDLERVPSAASAADRTALPAALAVGNTDETNLDLTGQLDRFVILCTPRMASSTPG
jgi:hypothetical protein